MSKEMREIKKDIIQSSQPKTVFKEEGKKIFSPFPTHTSWTDVGVTLQECRVCSGLHFSRLSAIFCHFT